jgi:nucleoid-associated protein YgaU
MSARRRADETWGRPAVIGSAAAGQVSTRERPRSRAGRRQLRRRRLAGLLRFIVFLLLIFIAVWAGVRVAHAGTDASVYTGHQYVVRSGDTLWAVAVREYGRGQDLRRAVFAISEVNELGSSSLQPGQQLTLPYLGD